MTDPLIPRADLFGNPSEAGTQISPDGRWLSWLAPVDGVLNVWVAPVDDRASALPVTQDTSRGIRIHCWTYLTDRLLYVHDIAGDENFHVFAVDVVDRTTKDLTPMKGVAARIARRSRDVPGPLRVLLAVRPETDGSQTVLKSRNDAWGPWFRFGAEDAWSSGQTTLDRERNAVYCRDSRGRDMTALTRIDLSTGAVEVVVEPEESGVGVMLADLVTKDPQVCVFYRERSRYVAIDKRLQPDLDFLVARDVLQQRRRLQLRCRTSTSTRSTPGDRSSWRLAARKVRRLGRRLLFERRHGPHGRLWRPAVVSVAGPFLQISRRCRATVGVPACGVHRPALLASASRASFASCRLSRRAVSPKAIA